MIFLVAGCSRNATPAPVDLEPRAGADPMNAVEEYLRQYQPGPLPRLFQTTRLYDRHGALLAELMDEGQRTWIPVNEVARDLINATVATEDATFFANSGVDPMRMVGAVVRNVQDGQISSGASTITMQLARNLFLGPEQRYDQTVDRKLLEIGLAQELTQLYSKAELLEMYLNLLNYGNLAYGPAAAAKVYFGKRAAELTLAQASYLAGIPQQPANLDPYRNFDATKRRQRIVLDLMVRHGYLTTAAADAAFAAPLELQDNRALPPTRAPHFVQYVVDQLDQQYGVGYVRRAGLQITTTLDLPMQELAERVAANHVAAAKEPYDLSNAALVAMQPNHGDILAMVGSVDFNDPTISGQVNVALRPRQPGSAIKPILYAAALDESLISPATVLWDTPVTYTISANEIYQPRNYDDRFHGPVTVRTALANSYNIPTVKLLAGLSVATMLEKARALGIQSFNQSPEWYGLSLTLGGGEVTLLELTTAFHTLAGNGRYLPPEPILMIADSQGRPLYATEPVAPKQVLSEATAFLISDILSDNVARTPAFGPTSPLLLSRPAAAKTGTTTDWRDNWTVGYTKYLVAGVWAGNSDGRPMRNTSGVTGAAPIWHDFMEGVLADPSLLSLLGAPVNE
ncbi:MAG: transglycosylase domain-containing protein, partial [Caldilineaceae bacterium]|nr:transglycosylase domain-containing protein [Caldilineaceae bacterium]